MDAYGYRFASTWTVDRAVGVEAATILADVEAYPLWWPQIRSVHRVRRDRMAVEIRSLLPYTLRLHLVGEPPVDGQREFLAEMQGDLVGWSSGGSRSRTRTRSSSASTSGRSSGSEVSSYSSLSHGRHSRSTTA
jgi:hypothetical protein